jgi:hypothetical protein
MQFGKYVRLLLQGKLAAFDCRVEDICSSNTYARCRYERVETYLCYGWYCSFDLLPIKCILVEALLIL